MLIPSKRSFSLVPTVLSTLNWVLVIFIDSVISCTTWQ
uniref:Uncharacterized protein n=1 Tax=Setaria italica TaxID=4555 RepID=K4ANR4_SETIT